MEISIPTIPHFFSTFNLVCKLSNPDLQIIHLTWTIFRYVDSVYIIVYIIKYLMRSYTETLTSAASHFSSYVMVAIKLYELSL